MKRIVYWALCTLTVVVLLFSYHTSTNRALTQPPAAISNSSASSNSASSNSASSNSASSNSASSNSASSNSASSNSASSNTASNNGTGSSASNNGTGSSTEAQTYTGETADTQWGPVQVEISVAGNRITGVNVVNYPTGNGRDEEINGYALPILIQETTDAQSAQIDMVSGATVTSDGYIRSLQSALDQAGL